ncbi:MAG TPA: nuclear transport factor 2 family protein [Herpetosiphonaceae bacterium]|nr:nuclear transport factor 2 family protein [Herpetosiphonaceae bacterium]
MSDQASPLAAERVRQLVERYYEAVRSLDAERYAAGFAEHGTLEDPVGLPAAAGRSSVQERYQPATAMFSAIKMYPHDVFAPEGTGEAAVRWGARLIFKETGIKVDEFFGITYFKFNPAGLIESARVFWNPADIEARALP